MYWDREITSEEEDEMILKIAKKIQQYELNMAAILLIESFRPLAFIGGQMGRFFISPLLFTFGEDFGLSSEKIFKIFEKHENVEKLIKAVEKLSQEDREQKKVEKAKKRELKKGQAGIENESKKTWWRRLISF